MSTFLETEASTIASATALLPSSSTAATLIVITFGFAFAALIHCASPIQLTRSMVSAIAAVEHKYLAAVESGLLSESDINQTGSLLSILQDKVSTMREASLRCSLSWRATLRDFLTGRTFTVLQCIWEARNLQTHIEILGEVKLRTKLRANNLHPLQTVSLRRRKRA
ncbi:hypothetical protein C8R45DRAFT_1204251 [Mycena sanguinolenta]|nr:hypothetical protein C8R45DRAFT_1204251 [Mycena sanguinolenta]